MKIQFYGNNTPLRIRVYITIENNDVIKTRATAARLNGFAFERAIPSHRQWHRHWRRTEQKLPQIAKQNPILSTQSTMVSTSTYSNSTATRPRQSKCVCILKSSLRSWGNFALWQLRNTGQSVFHCVDMVQQSGRRRSPNLSYFLSTNVRWQRYVPFGL